MKTYLASLQLVLALLAGPAAFAQSYSLPTTAGLIAHWPFNEGQGTTAANVVSSNYPATLMNAPTWHPAGGREGGRLELLNNPAQWVEVPGLAWQPTSFSVSWWLYPHSFNSYSHLLFAGPGWGAFMFHTDPHGAVYVGTDVNTRIAAGPLPAGTVELHRWQHFTFTYSGGTGRFYKNGRLLASKAGMTAPVAWNGFYMGNGDPKGAIHGNLDEVRIYNRALTDGEVQQLAVWPTGPVSSIWNPAALSSDWNAGANWLEGYAPAATSEVTINACTNCPQLATHTTVGALTTNGGSLDLAGYTLSTAGSAVFNRGTIGSGELTLNGPVCLFGNSTGGPQIHASVTVHSPGIYFANTIFHAAVNATWLANTSRFQRSTGGNVFNGPTTFHNASTSGVVQGYELKDVYNGDLTLTVSGGGSTQIAAGNGNHELNGDVYLNAPGGGGFTLGGSGTVKLKEGRRLIVTGSEFKAGLAFANFTQMGNTPQSFVLQGGFLRFYPGTVFNGDVDFKSSSLIMERCTFNGVTRLERFSSTGWNRSPGGNVFNGPAFITNSTEAALQLATSAPDTFNGDVTFISTNAYNGIWVASNSAGTVFRGNVTFLSSGPGAGVVSFGAGEGSASLEKDKKLILRSTDFPQGSISFRNFTQLGTTPQELLGAPAVTITLSTGTVFNGPLTCTAGTLLLNGTTFRKDAVFTKTGSGTNNSLGGNRFFGKVTIRNQGPAGSAINLATQANDELLPPPQ